jgi:hypothetical protein
MADDHNALLAEISDWLVEIGYPFDWCAPDHPVPHVLRRPLAEAWKRHDDSQSQMMPIAGVPLTTDDYLGTLEVEGAW